MKVASALLAALLLAGCQKFSDAWETGRSGYVLRCIDGSTYVLMTSEKGLAITPHLGENGKPKPCKMERAEQ